MEACALASMQWPGGEALRCLLPAPASSPGQPLPQRSRSTGSGSCGWRPAPASSRACRAWMWNPTARLWPQARSRRRRQRQRAAAARGCLAQAPYRAAAVRSAGSCGRVECSGEGVEAAGERERCGRRREEQNWAPRSALSAPGRNQRAMRVQDERGAPPAGRQPIRKTGWRLLQKCGRCRPLHTAASDPRHPAASTSARRQHGRLWRCSWRRRAPAREGGAAERGRARQDTGAAGRGAGGPAAGAGPGDRRRPLRPGRAPAAHTHPHPPRAGRERADGGRPRPAARRQRESPPPLAASGVAARCRGWHP